MRASFVASSIALIVLGVLLILEAFRNPLTFYSMFDFGVFALLAGLCLPFASEVERMVEGELGGKPMAPPKILASDSEKP